MYVIIIITKTSRHDGCGSGGDGDGSKPRNGSTNGIKAGSWEDRGKGDSAASGPDGGSGKR